MATETKGRGSQSIQRIFINDEGDPTARAQLDTNTVVFKYKDGAETRCELKALFGGQLPPASVGRAAAAFGVSTSCGNAGNSEVARAAKDSDVDPADVNPQVARDAVEERWANMLEGEWSAERELGPGTGLMIDALAAHRQAHGKATTDDDKRKYRELWKNKEEVKKALGVPEFRAIYEKMKMERTLARVASKPAGEGSDLLS